MYNYFKVTDYIKEDSKIAKMLRKSHGEYTDEIKNTQYNDRGITFDKKDTSHMNTNQFMQYAMTRVTARENAEGIWFYNFEKNNYELLSEDAYKKIFFNIIEEVSSDIWKTRFEREYISYFKNSVSQFTIDGNRPGFLQFNNCILDFSGEYIKQIEQSPDNFCNFRIPYDYDQDAECP